MYHTSHQNERHLCFARWSRRATAVFHSLGQTITIGQLSTSVLATIGSKTDSLRRLNYGLTLRYLIPLIAISHKRHRRLSMLTRLDLLDRAKEYKLIDNTRYNRP